jgi:hypothetical protein
MSKTPKDGKVEVTFIRMFPRLEDRVAPRRRKRRNSEDDSGYVFRPLPQKDPIYRLVGLVAATWAHFERGLDSIIGHLLPEESSLYPSCITAQLIGATPRFNAIIALLTMRSQYDPEFAPLIKKTKAILNKSYEIAEERNRIIHDPWYVESRSRQPFQWRTMPRKDLCWAFKPVSRQDVEKTLIRIDRLSDLTRQLQSDVSDAQIASQQRQHVEPPSTHPSSAPPASPR